jgi:hypothetical protein
MDAFLKEKNDNYYGSDLNKFIDFFCSHKMDCINIDCLQVKVSKKLIRIIESKKDKEQVTKAEKRVFNILSYLLRKQSEWNIEFCVVKGNYPFRKAEIYEWGSEEPKVLNQEELINYLNFEEKNA